MLNLLIAGLLFAFTAQAEEPPASPIATTELVLGNTATPWAAVTFTLPEGWHIYWQNPGDSGIATALKFTLPNGVSAGDIAWPAPERLLTDTIVNYGYSNHVVLPVPLTFTNPDAKGEVTVKANWLVCHDICIPESAELKGTLPGSDTSAIAATIAALPKPLDGTAGFSADEKTVRLTITPAEPLSEEVEFFPIENGISANDGPRDMDRDGNTITFTFARGYAEVPEQWNGVIKDTSGAYTFTATRTATPAARAQHATLIAVLALAFLGGVLLNLMPCVLPILSLKALALAKKGGASHAEARTQGISYTAGVIAAFLIIACIMLLIKSLGMAAGWGFQLQQPGFVAALILLMLLVALNLFGAFELPVLFGNLSTRIRETTPLGSFFTGALAVALATPCTTPFMAPAIGATLAMPAISALLVFAVLGAGMAFPFLLISFWPAALRLLPKPGAWMATFKKWIAVPILVTAAWLLWVLFHINGSDGIFITAIGGAAMVVLIKAGRIKQLKGLLLLAGIFIIAIATIVLQPKPVNTATEMAPTIAAKPFNEAALQALRDAGTPVFVDATATWCITCKFNERVALNTTRVQNYFNEHGVVFMVADWTRGDETITRYLASFGRNGVPLYVYYPPHKEPVLLPQLLTPSLVIDTLDAANP